MMNPVWIIDFLKKGSIESFFSTYHKALLQGDPEMNPARWFYVTEGKDMMSLAEFARTAQTLLLDTMVNGQPTKRLLPAWENNVNKSLNIIFAGDIEDNATQRLLLEYANLLFEHRDYLPAASIRFYALLWRSTASTAEPGVSPETFAFMQALTQMMGRDENNRFHKVMFFESSLMPEEKEKSFATMRLAALHIATHQDLGDGDEISRQYNNVLYNAGSAGTFYEKDVQHEQETFFLSNILLSALVTGNDGKFVAHQEAKDYLDKQTDFFAKFEAGNVVETIKSDCPQMPAGKGAYSVDSEVSPFSLNLKSVWKKYFNDYVINLKRNIINKTKKVLSEFKHGYNEILYSKQAEFVNSIKEEIEEKVFAIFKNPTSFDAVSIPQAFEILDRIKKRIGAMAEDMNVASIEAFHFPEYLKDAREQVEAEVQNNNPNDIISVLEGKLRRHPVYFFASFVRAIVLGALLCYTGITFFMSDASEAVIWGAGSGLFLLPVIISFWNFRERIVRIEALKDQYAAAMLLKCRAELNQSLVRCVTKTYEDIDQVIEWIRKYKLEFLQKNLSAVCPPEFSFAPSSRFQPLMKCMPYGEGNEGRVMIPATRVDVGHDSQLSGTFGRYPILSDPPVSKVIIKGDQYSFEEILQTNNDDLLRQLIRDLLRKTAKAAGNVEHNVKFEAIRTPRTKLLLLDVSGSMSDEDMRQLKEAVAKLSMTADIKWIAFNDKVVKVGDTPEEFDSLQSGGGTNYIPAIREAQNICSSTFVDQIILISDGLPFESPADIISAAHGLNQPLHTISIGESGLSVMKQISDATSGEQIIVNDIKELAVEMESKFNTIFTVGISGDYSIGELMQKCYIPGCAEALHAFSASRMTSGVTTIAGLLSDYADEQGMAEWRTAADFTCTHNPAVALRRDEVKTYVQMVCANDEEDEVKSVLGGSFFNPVLSQMETVPEILVSVLTLCPISKIGDLKWVTSNATK